MVHISLKDGNNLVSSMTDNIVINILFNNPFVVSLLILCIIMYVVILIINTDDINDVQYTKITLFTYLTIITIVILHNIIIRKEYKLKEDNIIGQGINFDNIDKPVIIQGSGDILNSGFIDISPKLPEIY